MTGWGVVGSDDRFGESRAGTRGCGFMCVCTRAGGAWMKKRTCKTHATAFEYFASTTGS